MTKEDLLQLAMLLQKYQADPEAAQMLAKISQILKDDHNHVVLGAAPLVGSAPD